MGHIATLVAGIVVAWGLVLAPAAMAQDGNDTDALNAKVIQLYHEGKYAEAIPLAERSLRIREKALNSDDPEVGQSLSWLATLYRAQGRYPEAEPLYKRALSIAEKALGPDHPAVAGSLNSLALLYRAQGRYPEAEPLYKRSIAIREKTLGADHPAVAGSLNNLALLYEAQGRYPEAEPLYKRSLAIREKALGPNHPDVADLLNSLAELYQTMGKAAEADEIQARIALLPPPGTRHLNVYFTTNRTVQQENEATGQLDFGAQDADRLTLGRATVQVGKKILQDRAKRIEDGLGQLDRSRGQLTGAGQLEIVRVGKFKSADVFARSAKDVLARTGRFPSSALIFVHGYNVDFKDAVKRAAQIAFDLDFDGVMILFAWPSLRAWYQYFSDTASADVAVDHLIKLIDMLRAETPDAKLNFLAHSMGNLVLLRALERIAERPAARAKQAFGEVIMANADVDEQRCRQLLRNVRPLVGGLTLYTNNNDWALWVSEKLRGKARCGSEAQIYDGVETIDTTEMGAKSGFTAVLSRKYNHNVFISNPLLFGEIHRLLLRGERPPHKRTPEFAEIKNDAGRTYWRYDKSRDVAAQAAVKTARQ